jgi:GNAT superfamily N-acetyltransferase
VSRVFDCGCGAQILGEGIDDLAPLVLGHFDVEHAELGLTLPAVRNYLEAEDRMTGSSERLESIGAIEVRPIGPETLEDILLFFDHEAMVGRPEWAGCYCMFFAVGDGWADRTWQENREGQRQRILDGKTTGVVAYVDGHLAGWLNATARSDLLPLATGDDEGVATIACFAISPPYRGHGLADVLLEGAVQHLKDLGFTRIEAYPAGPDAGDRAFPGPLSLYLEHGFVEEPGDRTVVSLP